MSWTWWAWVGMLGCRGCWGCGDVGMRGCADTSQLYVVHTYVWVRMGYSIEYRQYSHSTSKYSVQSAASRKQAADSLHKSQQLPTANFLYLRSSVLLLQLLSWESRKQVDGKPLGGTRREKMPVCLSVTGHSLGQRASLDPSYCDYST